MVHLLLAIIYLSFVSLGLPDALLGAAWPIMHQELEVPLSYAGVITIIVSMGTILSSLQSDRLTRALGPGKVTAFSVGLTALALFGFSVSREFWKICLWAIPYGLGAGSVDASLNNYVAVHYESRHMSWLHCCWGVGASIGPYILGAALTGGMGWDRGYRMIALLQLCLTAAIFLSLPLWKSGKTVEASSPSGKALSLGQVLAIPGAKEVMVAFFCYCALEQTAILWGSTYLVVHDGMEPEKAASLASLYLLGLTFGRAVSGFVTMKVSDTNMIRLGQLFMAVGVGILFLPLGEMASMGGLLLIGVGSAPVYPCVIHATPAHFGEENSQALVGVQMASAYVGTCLMPPLFGLIANHISASLLPVYLSAILGIMVVMYEGLNRKCPQK